MGPMKLLTQARRHSSNDTPSSSSTTRKSTRPAGSPVASSPEDLARPVSRRQRRHLSAHSFRLGACRYPGQGRKDAGRLVHPQRERHARYPNRLTRCRSTSCGCTRLCSPDRALLDRSSRLEADLATEWNSSDDLKTWRFKLRKGVEFHNGKSLTIQDCIYSLNRHRGEQSDSIIKACSWTPSRSMKADGDWLVIDIEGPERRLPDVPRRHAPVGHRAGRLRGLRQPRRHRPVHPRCRRFPARGRHAREEESRTTTTKAILTSTRWRASASATPRRASTRCSPATSTSRLRVDPKSIPIIEGAPNTVMANYAVEPPPVVSDGLRPPAHRQPRLPPGDAAAARPPCSCWITSRRATDSSATTFPISSLPIHTSAPRSRSATSTSTRRSST